MENFCQREKFTGKREKFTEALLSVGSRKFQSEGRTHRDILSTWGIHLEVSMSEKNLPGSFHHLEELTGKFLSVKRTYRESRSVGIPHREFLSTGRIPRKAYQWKNSQEISIRGLNSAGSGDNSLSAEKTRKFQFQFSTGKISRYLIFLERPSGIQNTELHSCPHVDLSKCLNLVTRFTLAFLSLSRFIKENLLKNNLPNPLQDSFCNARCFNFQFQSLGFTAIRKLLSSEGQISESYRRKSRLCRCRLDWFIVDIRN